MRRYKTPEEITAAFIKDGWSNDIHFIETPEETRNRFTPPLKGSLFTMTDTGNIFNDRGEIVYYANVRILDEPITIPVFR